MYPKLAEIRRRKMRGINLIEVIIAAAVLSLVALAIAGTVNASIGAIAPAEPKLVGQAAISNAQNDLQAAFMYDPGAANAVRAGQTITVTPSAAPAGTRYLSADTAATTLTVQSAPSVVGGTTQITLKYSVPGGTKAGPSTGTSVISLSQRAPGTCDPQLAAKLNPSNPTVCPTP